jgi:hypothetical protein
MRLMYLKILIYQHKMLMFGSTSQQSENHKIKIILEL